MTAVLKRVIIGAGISIAIAFADISPRINSLKTADDVTIRTATYDVGSHNNKYILLLPGLGEPLELFDDIAKHLNRAGYSVVIMDWRGQGGSTRATQVYSLCHVSSFDHYLRDLKAVLSHLPGSSRIIILANSMGGHLALRYLADGQIDARLAGLILVAPMIDIKTQKYPRMLARLISWIACNAGYAEHFVWGYKPFESKGCCETQDKGREHCKKECSIFTRNPNLAIGGPSFAWLEASFQSIEHMKTSETLLQLSLPILIISAKDDYLVQNEVQKGFCKALRHCSLLEYDSSHAIMIEKSGQLLGDVVDFTHRFF